MDSKIKSIYAIKHKPSNSILFDYRTNQGNVKKAFFTSERLAEDAIRRYIGYTDEGGKDYVRFLHIKDLEVIEIGKRYVK